MPTFFWLVDETNCEVCSEGVYSPFTSHEGACITKLRPRGATTRWFPSANYECECAWPIIMVFMLISSDFSARTFVIWYYIHVKSHVNNALWLPVALNHNNGSSSFSVKGSNVSSRSSCYDENRSDKTSGTPTEIFIRDIKLDINMDL